MTAATKWALGAGVLVLALIVALLPRNHDTAPHNAATPDLSAPRAAAALAPCPSATAAGEVTQLKGVTAECLGDGRQVDLGRALAGHTTILNVWATWCEPCKTELPVLADYAKRPGAAQVLLVQAASAESDGLGLLARLGVHLPSVFDGEGATGPLRDALKAPANLPASFLVTPDGHVRFIENPRVFGDSDQVNKTVEGV